MQSCCSRFDASLSDICTEVTNLGMAVNMGPFQPIWEGFAPTLGAQFGIAHGRVTFQSTAVELISALDKCAILAKPYPENLRDISGKVFRIFL